MDMILISLAHKCHAILYSVMLGMRLLVQAFHSWNAYLDTQKRHARFTFVIVSNLCPFCLSFLSYPHRPDQARHQCTRRESLPCSYA